MPTLAPLDLDTHCVAVAWLENVPHFALADGIVHRLDGAHEQVTVHDGLLAATPSLDGKYLISGGEDGRVCALSRNGDVEELANIGRKWVMAVAAGPRGAIAFTSGRTAHARLPDGTMSTFEHARTAEDVAFAPKGMRIAVARYDGATLHFPATQGKPIELEWAGAHNAITFSPNGDYLVTAMQENALHGWQLSDGRHMRMAGYPAKIKSLSWSAKGRWLASSGAPAAIVWPFQGKDGPMGKAPTELGTRGDTMVTCVAFHPADEVVAIGYGDGMVMAVRVEDASEVLLRRPGKAAVSALAWDKAGHRLAFGCDAGDCGVIDISE